jgi:predicted ester cyclase
MNTIGSPRPRRPLFLNRAMVIVTLLLISLLVPVAQSVAASPPTLHAGGSGSGSSNEATVSRLFNDVFSGKNAAACAELVAESAVIRTPDGLYTGHVGMNNFVDGLRASFPDASFRVTDMMTDGDTVVASWVMTGTQDGAFQSIAASGTPVTLNGITILRFELGMIVEEWVAYDRLHLVQQIESNTSVQNPPSGVCPPCPKP